MHRGPFIRGKREANSGRVLGKRETEGRKEMMRWREGDWEK
jgi:hypothetical protein